MPEEGVGHEPSIWRDRTFWAEIASTGGLGLVLFFALGLKDLGQVSWILGALLVYHRYVLTHSMKGTVTPLATQLHQVDAAVASIGTYLDLSQSTSGAELHRVITTYYGITEPELHWHRREAIEALQSDLHMLSQLKRSRTMHTSEYYGWLLPRIRAAESGSEIWAISRMMTCEWDDSPEEAEFQRLNIDAAKRGVKLTRLFVCDQPTWEDAVASLPPVQEQIACGSPLEVYFGELTAIQQRDPIILRSIGDGLIAFNRQVLLIDEHSDDGSARGYISVNPPDIARMRQQFESLRNLCRKVCS